MNKLFVKQKVMSLRGRFTVKDEMDRDKYFVEGSFMSIPKTFTITDDAGRDVGVITKKPVSFLPKFFAQVRDREEVTIQQRMTFLKAKYDISGENLSVEGDLLDKNFQVLRDGEKVARITEKWLSWGSAYEIDILEESLEELVVCFVIALDYVQESQQAAASSGGN